MRTLLRELITFGKTIYYLLGFNISIALRIKSVLSGAVIVSMFSWFSTILALKNELFEKKIKSADSSISYLFRAKVFQQSCKVWNQPWISFNLLSLNRLIFWRLWYNNVKNEFSVPNKKSSERVEKPEQPEEKPKQIKEKKPKPDGAKYRLKSKSVDASTQSSQIFDNIAYVSYICETSQFISKEITIWFQKRTKLVEVCWTKIFDKHHRRTLMGSLKM